MKEPLTVTPQFHFDYTRDSAPLLYAADCREILAGSPAHEEHKEPNPLRYMHTLTTDGGTVRMLFEGQFAAKGLFKRRKTSASCTMTMEATIDDPRLFALMTYTAKAVLGQEAVRQCHSASYLHVSLPEDGEHDYQESFHKVAANRLHRAVANGEKTDLPSSGITRYIVRDFTIEPPVTLSPIEAIGRQHDILTGMFGIEIANDTIRATYGAPYGRQEGELEHIYDVAMQQPTAIAAAQYVLNVVNPSYTPRHIHYA